jgi:hypothetical protein
MMLLVLIIVHHVLKTLITGIKQGHQVAYHVRMVRRRKKVAPNVNLVKQECLVRVLVKTVTIAMLVNTVKVKKTTMKLLRTPPFVLIVQRGIHRVLVVPSAKRVERVPMVMDVNPVSKAITVTAVI